MNLVQYCTNYCSIVAVMGTDQLLVDPLPVGAVFDVVEDDKPELQFAINSDSAGAVADRNSSNMTVALLADVADY